MLGGTANNPAAVPAEVPSPHLGPVVSATAPLPRAVREVEAHVAEGGWDQPPRLYALVPTDELSAAEPDLSRRLGLDLVESAGSLTPVEQEQLPADRPLEEVLERIMWPAEVVGVAAVVERLVLPSAAEAQVPTNSAAAARFVAEHPDRQEVRMVAGVMRDGRSHCVVRMRDHAYAMLEGDNLVPTLVRLLTDTMQE